MKCFRCQHENRPAAKFCEECDIPFGGYESDLPVRHGK